MLKQLIAQNKGTILETNIRNGKDYDTVYVSLPYKKNANELYNSCRLRHMLAYASTPYRHNTYVGLQLHVKKGIL